MANMATMNRRRCHFATLAIVGCSDQWYLAVAPGPGMRTIRTQRMERIFRSMVERRRLAVMSLIGVGLVCHVASVV
jgi:hypothetical protein